MRLFITLAFTVLILAADAQTLINTTSFKDIDSFATTVRYHNDLVTLARDLTAPYPDDLSKTRSIFSWITDNIAYDVRLYNHPREPRPAKCKTEEECRQVIIEMEKKYVRKVLKKRKAICSGYAMLFKQMCAIAGIRAEVIEGYTRKRPYQVGIAGPVNHAWNAVWVDSAWHLLDATWAAGNVTEDGNEKAVKFMRKRHEYYWFTPFHDLSRDHFPKSSKWIMEDNWSKDRFANQPFVAPSLLGQVQVHFPATGMLEATKGDTLRFEFEHAGSFSTMQVNTSAFRNRSVWYEKKSTIVYDTAAFAKQRYITPTRLGPQTYAFEYVVPDAGIYYLELLLDYQVAMRFRVKMKD